MPRTKLPIANGFYKTGSLPISAQNAVNVFPVVHQTPVLNQETLRGCPGVRIVTGLENEFPQADSLICQPYACDALSDFLAAYEVTAGNMLCSALLTTVGEVRAEIFPVDTGQHTLTYDANGASDASAFLQSDTADFYDPCSELLPTFPMTYDSGIAASAPKMVLEPSPPITTGFHFGVIFRERNASSTGLVDLGVVEVLQFRPRIQTTNPVTGVNAVTQNFILQFSENTSTNQVTFALKGNGSFDFDATSSAGSETVSFSTITMDDLWTDWSVLTADVNFGTAVIVTNGSTGLDVVRIPYTVTLKMRYIASGDWASFEQTLTGNWYPVISIASRPLSNLQIISHEESVFWESGKDTSFGTVLTANEPINISDLLVAFRRNTIGYEPPAECP